MSDLADSLDKPFKPTVQPRVVQSATLLPDIDVDQPIFPKNQKDLPQLFPVVDHPSPIFPKSPSREADAFSRSGGGGKAASFERLKKDFVSSLYLLGAMIAIVAVVLGLILSTSSEETSSNDRITSATRNIDQPESYAKNSEFSRWIEQESEIAFSGILANIGPTCGADDGVVIASPSMGRYEDEPDYYYTWTRDAALTISSLLPHFLPDQYLNPWTYEQSPNISAIKVGGDTLLEPLLRAFVASQEKLQLLKTKSGDLWDGGLNEPKYLVDIKPFDGDWGRPQRDGPALRALTLIPYAHYLLDRGYPSDIKYVKDKLYDSANLRQVGSVIKNDLEEVGGGWWRDSFDLWEEVDAQHLFTQLACLRALQSGVTLANRLNDTGAATFYQTQASKIIPHLQGYWDPNRAIWRATTSKGLDTGYDTATAQEDGEQMVIGGRLKRERTGLDCALPLSVIHAGGVFSSSGSGEADTDRNLPYGLGSSDPEVLASLREYVLSFDGLYGINKGNWTDGWALGRYREDIYNGVGISKGNPWYICTFSLSQVLYQAIEDFIEKKRINLHPLTIPFWRDILGPKHLHLLPSIPETYDTEVNDAADDSVSYDIEAWIWASENPMYKKALGKLGQVAERYLEIGKRFSELDEGKMSEQIHRHDGSPTGARDLTWSYASFLEVARARRRVVDLSEVVSEMGL